MVARFVSKGVKITKKRVWLTTLNTLQFLSNLKKNYYRKKVIFLQKMVIYNRANSIIRFMGRLSNKLMAEARPKDLLRIKSGLCIASHVYWKKFKIEAKCRKIVSQALCSVSVATKRRHLAFDGLASCNFFSKISIF